jgi:beta-fructofuranosidase
MGLRLEDAYVWDSWVADDGDRYHLFFLTAPRAGGPGARHAKAVIGHATSIDLVDWHLEPEALRPSPGAWDDLALWTGSVVRADDGLWWLFFTAINTRGHGLRDQRLGAATSPDLMTWTKVGDGPVLEADARWYKTLPEDAAASETWRDPFVLRDPDGDGWHMVVTARGLDAPPNADGVLAHAVSDDLTHWTLRPPLTTPAGFGQLEVAQIRDVGGRWVLLFTCHPQEQAPETVARWGEHSTWSVLSDSALGPWDIASARPFTAEPALFAAPLVRRRDGSWALIGFRNLEAEGIDAFEIVDPIPVEVRDGALAAIDPA